MNSPKIPPFLDLDAKWSDFNRSQVVILPLPYERTTSYGKGTALAPEEILKASAFVELYDEELGVEPFRLTDGIATLEPMKFETRLKGEAAVEKIRSEVFRLIEEGKTVICLGGEHTVAVGSARAYSEACPDLSILQLDAHSDLREEYEGSRYSHASAMARIREFHADIVQVGIRSQSQKEADLVKKEKIDVFYALDIKEGRHDSKGKSWHEAVIDRLKPNVYLTFDCDFFDPSLVPAVGTPEPGGFGWEETIAFLRRLASRRTIVGFDVNELAPVPPFVHSQFIVAKLIYKLIGYIFSK